MDLASWTRIASEKSNVVGSESEFFEYYSFDVPSNKLGMEMYVKIAFDGQTSKSGFSRLIIDNLIITTID